MKYEKFKLKLIEFAKFINKVEINKIIVLDARQNTFR